MIPKELFENIAQKIGGAIEHSPVKDFEKNIRSMLESTLGGLNMVSNEEFDIQRERFDLQSQTLTELQAEVVRLKERVAALEAGNSAIDKAAE